MANVSLPVSAIHFFYAGITRKKTVNQGDIIALFGYCCSTGAKTLTVKAYSGTHEVGWILLFEIVAAISPTSIIRS
jgi:hypothetical protein